MGIGSRHPPRAPVPARRDAATVGRHQQHAEVHLHKVAHDQSPASDTYGISQITHKVNSGTTQIATGTTSWQFKASLQAGDNKNTINAADSVGNVSASKVLKVVRE